MTLVFYRCLLLTLALVLASCGGGGSGAGGSPTISGQVVKGLTAGASVTLYSVSSTGAKSQVAATTTNSAGNYTFTTTLTPGQVYLIEATGGSYIDEITGAVTPLSSPLRAVVIGAAGETSFALSIISELAVIELENSSDPNKWSATSVNQSLNKIKTAFGLASLYGTRYFDLAAQTVDTARNLTDEEVSFSFFVHIFAGFFYESKQKISNIALSKAQQNFYLLTVANVERDDLNAIFAAGVISAGGKIPIFANNLASIYASLGLPINATRTQLNLGEYSGSVVEPVPSEVLKLIDNRGYLYVNDSTTIFNDRGALLAYQIDSGNSSVNLTNWTHLGYASVADVYGTSETAIGRWNGGYYFPTGISYDVATRVFNRNNQLGTPLVTDKVYAAGIPATNLPNCGRLEMSLKGKTTGFIMPSGLKLTLDDASKIKVQYINGAPYVAYQIILNASNGVTYSFLKSIETPWSAPAAGAGMQFGGNSNNTNNLSLPNGESLVLTGLLSGNGGKKAVISITSYYDRDNPIIAAAFAADSPLTGCADYVYAIDTMSSFPITGIYWYSYSHDAFPWYGTNLSFFANGSPNFPSTGLSASSGLEKVGNAQAGIGVLAPPFKDQSGGATITTHTPYFYRQADSVAGWPSSGVATYQMVAVTPTILTAFGVVISAKKSITSANLKVYFNQTSVAGLFNNQGTCELSLVDNGIQNVITTIYRTSYGLCDGWPLNIYETSQFTGGVTSGNSQYATVVFKNNLGGMATILFSRSP